MSGLAVRPVEPHEMDTWDEFVENSPQGTLFHSGAWKHVVDKALGSGRLVMLGCFDEFALCGGVVLLDRERFGQRTAVTPLLTPYVGFLLDSPPGEKLSDQISRDNRVLDALARALIEKYGYVSLINPPALEDTRPLSNAGFVLTPRFTYLLNLRLPVEELWMRLDGSVRRQVRKAERADFDISDNLDPELGFRLLESTFTRRGEACPVPRAFFDEIVESERLRDARRVLCAHRGGELASFIVGLRDARNVYYAVAATNADLLAEGVSSLLVWEMMKTQASEGAALLDFVGANIPSIARFKEGFNPRLQIYFQAEHYSSSFLKLGKSLADMIL